MPVRQALEDLDFPLQIVEELGAKTAPVHRLDGYLVMCLLCHDENGSSGDKECG